MREIKFRGKRTDTKEWVYGSYFKQTASQLGEDVPLALARVCHCIMVYGEEYFHVDGASVGQYTGLEDKNSVEIYEGDIMNLLGEVKYTNACPEYDILGWEGIQLGLTEEDDEVVGNIHEHPGFAEDKNE